MIRLLAATSVYFLLVASLSAQETAVPQVTTSLDKSTAIPGQPLLYRVTVLVPTWLPSPPVFPNFEVPNVMVRLPSRASGPTSKTIDSETWSGVTRAYRLYPLIPGKFQIPSGAIQITYADAGTSQPIKTDVLTEAFEIVGEIPLGAEDLSPFLAARSLSLERKVEGNPDALEAGAALTITTTAKVAGVPPMVVPALSGHMAIDGISVYPKEPVNEEEEDRGLLSGSRTEEVTLVAEFAGSYEIPEFSLSWYNLESGQIETETVPAIALSVTGTSSNSAEGRTPLNWRPFVLTVVITALFLAALVFAGRWAFPRISNWWVHRWCSFKTSESYSYLMLRRAVRERDFDAVSRAGSEWRNHLDDIAPALDWKTYETALLNLGQQWYAPGQRGHTSSAMHWRELTKTLQTLRKNYLIAKRHRTTVKLPSLNPPLRS